MRRLPVWSATWILLGSCTGGPTATKGDTDTDASTEPPLIEVCADDSECELDEVCNEAGECEPGDRDNSFDEATGLLFEEPKNGVIFPPGDKDFYAFETLSPGQWVLLETVTDREDSEDLDTVIRLYQANGLEHAFMDNYDIYRIVSADSSLVAYLPMAGTWYVSVEDVSTYYDADGGPRGSTDFTYELSLTRFEAVTSESGDPPLVELESGTRISRRGVLIDAPGDQDQLVVRAPYDDRLLQITGGRNAPGSMLLPQLTTTLDGEVVNLQDALDEDSYAHILSSVADDYVVTIEDAGGGGGENYWTVLYLRTYEEDASVTFWGDDTYQLENSMNDDAEAATPILRSDQTTASGLEWRAGYVEGTIESEGDEDWYSFEIAGGNNTTVRCYADRFGSLVDLAFDVLDADENVIESVTEYAPWSAPQLYNLEGATARYLRVYAEDDSWGPAAFYRCQLVESEWEVAQ